MGFARTPIANPPESIESGNYGSPPKATWWLKQSFIYFIGLFGMKLCVLLIFELFPWIAKVGDWALRWTEGNEAVQIAFVMLIFPLIMNALQYYIIDTFIKGKTGDHEPIPSDDEEGQDEDGRGRNPSRQGLLGDGEGRDSLQTDDDEEELSKAAVAPETEASPAAEEQRSRQGSRNRDQKSQSAKADLQEYDPDKDGENVRGSQATMRSIPPVPE